MEAYILTYLIAYLLGTFPTGVLITKFFLGYDITKQGSGNIGMTNVMRTGGKKAGVITLLFDFLKGTLAVFLFSWFHPEAPLEYLFLSGVFAIFGHTCNIWLKGKGGKGIATHFGIWAILDPTLFLIQAFCWIGMFLITRVSSLSALTSLLVLITTSLYFYGFETVYLVIALEVIYLFFLHRENIQRLIQGKEKKLETKK